MRWFAGGVPKGICERPHHIQNMMRETALLLLISAVGSWMMRVMTSTTSHLRATVVGLTGKQASVLRQQVGKEVRLRILTPERALRLSGNESDVVITTRFIGHKHEWHLRRVSSCRVVCLHSGGAQAVIRALQSMSVGLAAA